MVNERHPVHRSFGRIVVDTAPSLFRLAARLTGSEHEAEDVLQESYIRAWQALNDGRFDGRSSLETWLYRIVTNCALDSRRANQRRGRFRERLEREPSEQAGRADMGTELRELSEWLGELPPDQRAAIVLKDLEGLKSTEVAEVLGCSEGAVEQRLVRARATLRRRCQGDERNL